MRLVLFLETRKQMPMKIAWVGRGVMTLRDVEGKPYATLQDKVKLPEGTKTISEQRMMTISLPPPPNSRARAPVSLTLPYTVRSVELSALRDLVRRSGQ